MGMDHRLGIDINGVIISRETRRPGKGIVSHATLSPVDSAFESIQTLVQQKFSPEHVYLISKSSGGKRVRTLRWLNQHRFYEQTGILRSHVYFCESRQDKAHLCEKFKITHFIDDRLEVLSYLTQVPHLYLFQPSKTEIERFLAALPSVHQVESWQEIVQLTLSKTSMTHLQ